jgi:ubiquinone/menaquinone biosynthesis C-methylase UbiE
MDDYKTLVYLFVKSGSVGRALDKVMRIVLSMDVKTFLDLNSLCDALAKEKPVIVLVGALIDYNANPYDSNRSLSVREILKKIRQYQQGMTNRRFIIGMDWKEFMKLYFDGGADYFIPMAGLELKDLQYRASILTKIAKGENMTASEKQLVKEKKDFYNEYAAMLNERADKTANTGKELEEIIPILEEFHCKDILDGGCGQGRISFPLADKGFNVVGVDISDANIRLAMKSNQRKNFRNPQFQVQNLLHLGFKDNSFDAALLLWHTICELREYRDSMLREAYRVLRKDGLVIMDFPDRSKEEYIDNKGNYRHDPGGISKYFGVVPELENFIIDLKQLGFEIKGHMSLKAGINKLFVVAQKKTGWFS